MITMSVRISQGLMESNEQFYVRQLFAVHYLVIIATNHKHKTT